MATAGHQLLDNDFYTLTMAQLIWKHYPDQVATYELIERGSTVLADYLSADEAAALLRPIQATRITSAELDFLARQRSFDPEFLEQLVTMTLPPVQVIATDHGWTARAQGTWWQAIWWETPALAAITSGYQHQRLRRSGISAEQAHRYGLARLDAKIELLREHPEIRFAEFGARRRFGLAWQDRVVGRLKDRIPDQLAGTSNMLLAWKYGLPMIGTMAHQLFMGVAALWVRDGEPEAIGRSQQRVLEQWEAMYGDYRNGELLIFLTDTYSTQIALDYLPPAMARRWAGMRQDSGDPIAYGEELLAWYVEHGIDPIEHFMLCSDGLTVPRMIEIAHHFAGRLPVRFGIGTDLVNDLVQPAPNIVWKIVEIDGQPVVKLSDDPAKATGPADAVEFYREERERLGATP